MKIVFTWMLIFLTPIMVLCNEEVKFKGFYLGMNTESVVSNLNQRFPLCNIRINTFNNITTIKVLHEKNATPKLYAQLRLHNEELIYCQIYPHGVATLYNYYIYLNPVEKFATIFHSAYFNVEEVLLQKETISINRNKEEIGTQEIFIIEKNRVLIEIYGNGSMDFDKVNILTNGNTPPGTIIMKRKVKNVDTYLLDDKTLFD